MEESECKIIKKLLKEKQKTKEKKNTKKKFQSVAGLLKNGHL
jgi:hypothetical protein